MAICTICGLVTEYLKQHMSNHGDERNFACDKCKKVCQGYKQLMNHKKSHMTWNCTNCDQVIPHNSRSIHLRRCKNESNVLSCEKCPYITNDKSNLNKHMKTHAIMNGEFVESSHYSFKKEERTHGFKVKRAIGTPKHLEKSLKSLVWHNSKRAGFTPPSKLQLRKYSPYSSPYSSPFSGR